MDILNPILATILVAALTPIAIILGKLLAKLIKKGINSIDNTLIRGLAWQAVLFVDQKFKTMHGKDKFDQAYTWLAKKLPGVDAEDIEQAIEAAVKEMNSTFPKAPGA